MNEPIPPDEVLPCGCILRCAVVDGRNVLTAIPCKMNCANLRNLLKMADDEDKPVEHRRG